MIVLTEKAKESGSLSLSEIQARVDRVSIDGLERTKDDFVVKTVTENGLFTTSNFAEMLEKSQAVKSQLDSLGCFQNVIVQVDTSSGPNSTPEYGYEVTFVVRELKQIAAALNGTVGTNNEGLVVASARAPNILGRGEKLAGEISYGNKQTKNFNITLSKPIHPKHRASVSASVYAQDQEWPMSKYNLRENGVLLDLSFQTLKNLKHSLQWEAVIRDLAVGNRFAAFEVRENAGSTLKSSLKNIIAFDTRKTVLFPTSGLLLKLTTEFAGIGGNIGFLKNDIMLQVDLPIIADVVLQGSVSGGCMLASNNKNKSLSLCDNFFLGGPNTFRGFELRGASPSTDGTYVGAKMFWQAGVSLFTPLPFRPSVGGFGEHFRTHLFANVGNIGNFTIDGGLQDLMNQARLACGIGLALRLGYFARLEINYCLPTWVQEGDRSVQGIQIGLSAAL